MGFYKRFASGNDFGAAAHTHRHTLQKVKARTAVYQWKVQLTDGKRKRNFRYVADMCALHTYIRGSYRQGLGNATLLISAVYVYCRAHETKTENLIFVSKKGEIDTYEKTVEL